MACALVLYASAEAHATIAEAADMLGLGERAVRAIATDDGYRMRLDDLAGRSPTTWRAGMRPFAVVATAGTTATGAIDPLPAIADLCAEHGLWLHVDAAYGGGGRARARAAPAAGRDRAGRLDRLRPPQVALHAAVERVPARA